LHQLCFQLLSTCTLKAVSISILKIDSFPLFFDHLGFNCLFSDAVLKEVGVLLLLLEHDRVHTSSMHFRAKVNNVLSALEQVRSVMRKFPFFWSFLMLLWKGWVGEPDFAGLGFF